MANKNIKGITIEIGGDTTKLGKALEQSEKKSRNLQVELKQIQQSLKFNPSNVELLTQKQEVLTQTISETSDKLEILKEAERQVIAQFERGEVAEEQVRALQREIIRTENQLESMSSELDTTARQLQEVATNAGNARRELSAEEIREATDAYEELGDKASSALESISTGALAVGAGIGAIGGYATNLVTEFDKAYNTLQTQTGATAEEMEKLEESIDNIYKSNFGESVDDVARAMATVKTQTKLSGQELEDITTTAILMRDTFEFEVDESIRGVNSLMKQFGISAEEAYTLIAQGAQKGLNQNGDLMDVINEYAVQFKGAGYNAEEMFNMLVNGAEAGTWSVDKLGDAVKEYNIRMTDGSASEYLEKLGLNVDKITTKYAKGGESAQEANNTIIQALKGVENEQERYMIGQGIMGTMWEDLGEDAIFSLMSTQGEISKTSDALERINEIKYDDLGSALGGLGRTIQTDLIKPIGEELKPVVEEAIDYVKANGPAIKNVISNIVKAVGGVIGWIVDNKEIVIGAITAIGAGFLAWKAVMIISSIIPVFTAFISVIKGGTVAFKALNLAMKANVIGIIVTAVVALITILVSLWKNCEGFRNFFINMWNIIKDAVGVAIEAIVGFFSSMWENISSLWSSAVEWFRGMIDSIVGFFSSAWDSIVAIWSGVTAFFMGIWNGIVEIFSPAIEWFSALFTSIYNTLASIINVIIGIVKGCWDIIVQIFSVAGEWFNTNVIQPVAKFFTGLWNTIKDLARGCWNGIVDIFKSVGGWFNSTVIKPVTDTFTGLWNKLKSGASSAWSGIKSVFSSVADWFGSIFGGAWKKVKDVFSAGGQIFASIKDGIVNGFKTVVNAIIGGINKVVSVPFNFINGALNKVRNVSFMGISPFKNMWKQNPISVPQIPMLYRGGVLKKGQVGLLEGNGAEAVVPLEKETAWISRIAQKMNELQEINPGHSNVALASKMDEVIRTMKALKSTIVLDTGVLVGETLNQIDEGLGTNYSLRERRI